MTAPRWLTHLGKARASQLAVGLAALGFLLVLPSLGVGLQALDDFEQHAFIVGKLRGDPLLAQRPWFDVYNLASGDANSALQARWHWLHPWWSYPGLKVRFFRPLAAAALYFDCSAFGENYWLAHLHSACWYFAACFVVALLVMRLCRDRWVALLGALLFVVDDAHAPAVSWLAARNSVIGVTFLALALLFYDRGAKSAAWRWTWIAAICFLAALLAVENALSGAPLFVAYAALLDPRPLRARATSVAVILGVGVAWYGGHKALGFGTHGAGSYLDPFHDGAAFWAALPQRYSALLNMQFAAPWPLTGVVPLRWLLNIEMLERAVVLPATLVFIARNFDKSRELAFWCASAALGLLPLTAAEPHERLLMHVGIALWMVAAHFMIGIGRWAFTLAMPLRACVLLGLIGLGIVQCVLAPIALALESRPRAHGSSSAPVLDAAAIADAHRPAILINAPSLLSPLDLAQERARQGLPMPDRIAVLGATVHEVEVTRVDASTVELYSPPGYLLDTFSNFWRGPSVPLHQGERIAVDGFTALVVRVTPDGRPLRVRFTFDGTLDNPALRFMYWNGRKFADFPFGPPQQRRVLPAAFDGSHQLPEHLVN